jgi:hypothetical protein
MKKSRKMKSWIAAALCLLIPFMAFAGDIVATGGWNRTIDSSDLASGPGSDLDPSCESVASATSLDVTAVADFRVDVRRSVGTWSGDLTVYVRRTSTGTGAGSVSGGDTYQAVTAADAEFFTGDLDRTGIEVQYKVDGFSVDLSPDTYTANVFFTITDL